MSGNVLRSLVFMAVAAGSLAANAQSVTKQIPLSNIAEGVAVNLATNRIYAAVPSFGGTTDTISVVDGSTDSVVASISVPPMAYAVAVNVLTNKIYVGGCATSNDQCSVIVIDGFTNSVLSTIPVTAGSRRNGIQGLAINPFTNMVYVSNSIDDVVNIIDGCQNTVVGSISLSGQRPFALALNPLNFMLYVGLANGTVDVVNTLNNSIAATASVGSLNTGVAANLLTGNVFVTNDSTSFTSNVAVLNSTGSVVTTVPVGKSPFAVDVDFVANLAFVTNIGNSTVSVIDGSTNTVKTTVSAKGTFLAANPVTQKVYISSGSNLLVMSEK